MQIPHDGVVLVADGAKMLFFRNKGDAMHPDLIVETADQQADAPDRAIKSDAAGRASGAHASVDEPDYHQQNEDRFAAEAADMLNRAALAGFYEQLIVVAPPKTLGELRKHYHGETERRLIGELAKDLVSHPVDRIEAAITAA